MITQTLKDLINDSLVALNLPQVEYTLEHPASEVHGDYATNLALVLYPQVKDKYPNPRTLAEAIAAVLKSKIKNPESFISDVNCAGPGFINFTLNPSFFLGLTKTLVELKSSYGFHEPKNKTVIVEYSSPNIAKPFTFGHLRSTVIGDALANLYQAIGWTVLRDNHLGDWGTQFGKQIYAIKTWGDESALVHSKNPVKELVALYVKFHQEAEINPTLNDQARQWFKKLESGDPEARRLWQKCIDWSWQEFERIYEKLGIKHSPQFEGGRGLGESFFENKMQPVIDELVSKNLLQSGKEGAKLVFFADDKYPPAMILKKDGATLYHTRDLATDKYRLENYHPDLIINEVGIEQELYFKQLFEIEYLLGWYQPGQRIHVGHGFIRFKDRKMSTRKGDVIWLEEVIEEAITRAKKLQKEIDPIVAQQVAIGALKWNDLKGAVTRDIIFDWDEILNMKGNSGPYLQYTHARCCSVLSKSKINLENLNIDFKLKIENFKLFPEELSLLRWFYRYPEVVTQAATELAPHLICTYLYELAQRYNTFYNKHSILGSADKPLEHFTGQLRLLITAATARIIKTGLNLLGIQAPERM